MKGEKKERVFISLDEAIRILDDDDHFAPLKTVELPLDMASGYVLAQDIISREGHPPFSMSSMDGYALRAADTSRAGARLRLAGTVMAGMMPEASLEPGTCIKIMTGAPIPGGTDCVVMQEDACQEGEFVIFRKAARAGQYIRFMGEDIKPGEVACREGTLLAPAAIGVCALMGSASVKVYGKPDVTVITTGDEIAAIDDPALPPGFVRNSNGPMLISLLGRLGINGRHLGVVPDQPERLTGAIREGMKSDLLLVTGGVSVGQFDYVVDILSNLGLEFLFKKVRVKPGKPLHFACGKAGKVFGIPGNPVSVLVSFHVFIGPALKRMMGLKRARQIFEGRLKRGFECDPERVTILPCRYEFKKGSFELSNVRLNGSGDIVGASRANCLAFIPQRRKSLERGRKVKFMIMEQ